MCHLPLSGAASPSFLPAALACCPCEVWAGNAWFNLYIWISQDSFAVLPDHRIATISKGFCPLSLCLLRGIPSPAAWKGGALNVLINPPDIFLAMFSFPHPVSLAFNFLADAEMNFPLHGPNAHFPKQTWPLQLCKKHWGGSTESHGLLLWLGAPGAPLQPHDQKVCQP